MTATRLTSVFLLLLFSSITLFAQQQNINSNPLSATGSIHPKQIPIGANTQVTIDIELAEKHHAYLESIKLKASSPLLNVGKVNLNPTVTFFDTFSKKEKIGIENHTKLTAVVELPLELEPGDYDAKFILTYQACTKKYCLLPKDVEVIIPITAIPASSDFVTTSSNPKSEFDTALKKGLIYLFLIVFGAGFLTSLTPCIFPMIPITLAVIGSKSVGVSHLRGFILSLFYVLGIATMYSVLGLIAASSGSLFGAFLGSPIVAGAISLLFVMMALSMFGLYDIRPPAFIANKFGAAKGQNGLRGAFVTGIFAGIVASPCVGPVLISILTYVAKTQDHVLGFFLLFTFAMGFGVLFMILGTFSQLVNKLPKAGPWMARVKIFFGIVLLGLALYYIYPVIPKSWFPQSVTQQHSIIKWQPYTPEVFAQAKQDNKAVIIDFYADWCLSCKEMESTIFVDVYQSSLGKNFVWVQFDGTNQSPEFDKLREKYNILGLPHIVIYDDQGNQRKDLTLTGKESLENFKLRLKQALTK